jgi:hypothetical protein
MRGKVLGGRFDRITKYVAIAVACGGIPFFFIRGAWGELLLKAYLLTAPLLYVLLLRDWESTKHFWFWKAMIPIILVHSGIVLGLAMLNLEFPEIDRLPRAAYGVLAAILTVEVLGFGRFIEACRPKPAPSPTSEGVKGPSGSWPM